MTPPPLPRLVAVAAAVTPLVLLASGCQAAPVQPRTAVTCTPGAISIEVTNTSRTAARYTVSVEITRAGDTETEQYSSNLIEAGATGTITDILPPERATCRVTGVQVFSA